MEAYSYTLGIASYLSALWVLVISQLISRSDDQRVFQIYSAAFLILLIGFFVVWGGFSPDSVKLSKYFYWYLDKFPDVNFYFLSKAPSFLLGSLLQKVFDPPWPMKLMQGLVVLLIGLAIFKYFDLSQGRARLTALAILLVNPAFFFLAGNVVRQGLATGLFLLTLLLLLDKKFVRYGLLAALAVTTHAASILPIAAALAAKLIPARFLKLLLLIAPLASFIANGLFSETELVAKLIYRDNSEGALHYEKFAVLYVIAWIVLFDLKELSSERAKFIASTFVLTVVLSSAFLYFEIPYERFSLFAQITLVLVLPELLGLYERRFLKNKYARAGAYCLTLGPCLLLWMHPAILESFGYLKYLN